MSCSIFIVQPDYIKPEQLFLTACVQPALLCQRLNLSISIRIYVQYRQSVSDRQINFTDGTFRSIGQLLFTVGQCFTDGNMSCNAGSA